MHGLFGKKDILEIHLLNGFNEVVKEHEGKKAYKGRNFRNTRYF